MRSAAAVVAVGVAVAVGVPTAWALTRPTAADGPAVVEVVGGPASTASAPPVASGDLATGVGVRDAAPPPVQEAAPAPVRLVVPALGVDAAVDPVGVQPDGAMVVPAEVDRVGWYRYGPVPGQDGGAVLAGHVDSRTQGTGAMAPLREAEVGQEVRTTDAEGRTSTWRVVAKETLEKEALPVDELFTRSGPPRLVLITCGGPFLEDIGSYRDNVVVVAEPVDLPAGLQDGGA